MSEVDRHGETLTQSFMTGELFPVVDRECLTQLLRDAAKRSLFRCVESSTCAVFHLRGDEISALAFDTGHDHARVSCTVNGVAFPVTEATSRINFCRAVFDAGAIPDAASTVHATSFAIPTVTQVRP